MKGEKELFFGDDFRRTIMDNNKKNTSPFNKLVKRIDPTRLENTISRKIKYHRSHFESPYNTKKNSDIKFMY
jgi:hypothetical protein